MAGKVADGFAVVAELISPRDVFDGFGHFAGEEVAGGDQGIVESRAFATKPAPFLAVGPQPVDADAGIGDGFCDHILPFRVGTGGTGLAEDFKGYFMSHGF